MAAGRCHHPGRRVGEYWDVPFAATLRWVVASSATSYGCTLTIWATSAVLLHHRGIRSEAGALAFVLGAIAAFAVVDSSRTAGSRA